MLFETPNAKGLISIEKQLDANDRIIKEMKQKEHEIATVMNQLVLVAYLNLPCVKPLMVNGEHIQFDKVFSFYPIGKYLYPSKIIWQEVN